MPSNSLEDFRFRMEEVSSLLNSAQGSQDPRNASMYAKCAIVLACAALERYMNDVLEEFCSSFNEQSWQELSQGRQRYLLRHIALKMEERATAFTRRNQVEASDCDALIRFVRCCGSAVENPSNWSYFSDFGIFGEGTSAPDRIDAVVRAFDSNGRSLYGFMEACGEDRRRVLSGLQQLVEARHAAAHALKGTTPPGPEDGIEWVRSAVVVAECVDRFLDL
ncbi:HEPN domain-containing protein [Azoarcus sp. KH32C]|uniref:HEPN domain-containing protein n=1 Tax=Azoarcus sp. KH32C TaxID=748247 RepID=UPI0002385E58|nr:HEPN domain-containing protein [Azoarcus sp. KH32C]BAL22357.1 hypothetical protein AZKH_0005 [Azoarcus sp. KH32C]